MWGTVGTRALTPVVMSVSSGLTHGAGMIVVLPATGFEYAACQLCQRREKLWPCREVPPNSLTNMVS